MKSQNNFKPILFSTEMVQAILADRKTQTRRIVKPQPDYLPLAGSLEMHENLLKDYLNEGIKKDIFSFQKIKSGDILWVRETHKVGAWNDEDEKIAFDYKASRELKNTHWCYFNDSDTFNEIHLKLFEKLDKKGIQPIVDEENERISYKWKPGQSPFDWSPSLFMPKEACRIFLKVTDVRCERLNDICAKDAKAEGINNIHYPCIEGLNPFVIDDDSIVRKFKALWDSINIKKAPWKSNPWVWVYDFEKIEKPLDFLP